MFNIKCLMYVYVHCVQFNSVRVLVRQISLVHIIGIMLTILSPTINHFFDLIILEIQYSF